MLNCTIFWILISCLLQKNGSKNGAAQQTFGPSYFVRALVNLQILAFLAFNLSVYWSLVILHALSLFMICCCRCCCCFHFVALIASMSWLIIERVEGSKVWKIKLFFWKPHYIFYFNAHHFAVNINIKLGACKRSLSSCIVA